MSKVLVKFHSDWADEFSVYGHRVYEKAQWETLVETFVKSEGTFNFSFGTNEAWEEEEPSEWIRNYNVIPITDETASVLQSLFGTSFGIFPEPIVGDGWDDDMFDDE